MENRRMELSKIQQFEYHLREDEKSAVTIEKYIRDITAFKRFSGEAEIDKKTVLSYKDWLADKYAATSANSMLAALNAFFRFCGWFDLCVRQFKIQRKAFCAPEKELTREEYNRLVRTARKQNNERLALLIQTICATGIRVSELSFITVEAVKRGEASVSCKGKIRTVFIISALQKKLLSYARMNKLSSGPIFVTKVGRTINRSNVWKEMKSLCKQADVSDKKVFPHNLRHLFARTFYSIEKDIAKLADVLGHSNIETTRIYIMTTGTEHRRRLETMRLVI